MAVLLYFWASAGLFGRFFRFSGRFFEFWVKKMTPLFYLIFEFSLETRFERMVICRGETHSTPRYGLRKSRKNLTTPAVTHKACRPTPPHPVPASSDIYCDPPPLLPYLHCVYTVCILYYILLTGRRTVAHPEGGGQVPKSEKNNR